MKKLLLVAAAIAFAGSANAQTAFTNNVNITTIETLANSQRTFIRVQGGWGHPNCPTAQFVTIDAANGPSYTQLLALALTAQAAGTPIAAFGTCSTSGTPNVLATRLRTASE